MMFRNVLAFFLALCMAWTKAVVAPKSTASNGQACSKMLQNGPRSGLNWTGHGPSSRAPAEA